MSSQATQLKPFSDLFVQTLRFTSFYSQEEMISMQSLSDFWTALLKAPPETKTEMPNQNTMRLEGLYGTGKLSIQKSLGRIDLLYEPVESSQTESCNMFVTLGKFQDSLSVFTDLVEKLIAHDKFPQSARIAFGAAIIFPVTNRQEGYEYLNHYLKNVKLDAKTSQDFLYQINRPCTAKALADLSINRLARWSIAAWMRASFAVQPDGKSAQQISEPRYAFHLDLDINTSNKYVGNFSHQQSRDLYTEINNLAKEICEKGEPA